MTRNCILKHSEASIGSEEGDASYFCKYIKNVFNENNVSTFLNKIYFKS